MQLRPPEKQAKQKMTTTMMASTKSTSSFILMFCHHILLRSARPLFWNWSACGQCGLVRERTGMALCAALGRKSRSAVRA